jgi:Ser/Thr protein kinase RdoA (MazF antagonist)
VSALPSPIAFDAAELAVVLSHYDIGVIESLTPFTRGSRASPKVGVVAQHGKFLLKRRAPRRAQMRRVEVAHLVQKTLVTAGFPAPRLIDSRTDGRSFVRHGEHVYELFEFVPGHPYERAESEARSAGEHLARFHEIVGNLAGGWTGPRGDYHDAPAIRTGLCSISTMLSSHDSFAGLPADLEAHTMQLLRDYDAAAAEAYGVVTLPRRIVHADWHPGNVLFRKGEAVAVIDYDSVRMSCALTDVANGALQFSMIAGGSPDTWPEHLEEDLLRAFVAGYTSRGGLSDPERAAIPPLMIEALIAECVPPIAATGSVGRWSGWRVLQMIRRKIDWMTANRARLLTILRLP